MEHALTKVCNTNRSDWDLDIPAVLWEYRTIFKRLTRHIPFKSVYGKEAVMPMEYIVPSLRIAEAMGKDDGAALEEHL